MPLPNLVLKVHIHSTDMGSKATAAINMPSAKKFNDFLNHLRASARNEREKGELFELAIRDFLRQSPEHNFADVQLWRDWDGHTEHGFTRQDLGIDLVAEENDSGNLWAVQCKFYQEDTAISRESVNSFLASARGETFNQRLIVTTTNNWGKNAQEILNRKGNACRIIGPTVLESAPFDWLHNGKVKRQSKRKEPFPHQKEAVDKAEKHFAEHNRGKLIMACGSGKTYTSLKIAEAITPARGRVLFLAPSISLVAQTLKEYAYEAQQKPRFVVVCSDSKADKDSDGYKVVDLPIPPTTDATDLAKVLSVSSTTRTIVFCTYQSLERIKEAQDLGAPEFDLTICDEAHRTTGVESAGKQDKKGNYFTLINNPEYVQTRQRIYMTATPRLYNDSAKQ